WQWLLEQDLELGRSVQAQALAMAADDARDIALANEAWVEAGGPDAQARVMRLLDGLGFSTAQSEQPVQRLSGGWRMRLNLARALFVPSDLLLLDEPSNHLDLDAVLWLERWLKRYEGLCLIVSHDRDFLDACVQHTIHVDEANLRIYRGGYTAMERARVECHQQAERLRHKQDDQRAHLERFIQRFRAQATKARQVQSRIKMLESIQAAPRVASSLRLELPLDEAQDCPDPIISGEDLTIGYAPLVLCRVRRFTLGRGDRIGLLGANGAGKSTWVKHLVGEMHAIEGRFSRARHARLGYFSQSAVEELRAEDNAIEHLRRLAPNHTEQALRDWLGRFAIRGDEALRPIAPMSGGERARIALAALFIHKPQALILDEPTNHLDAMTRDALAEALAGFQGALLLVSHDRYLLRACVDSLWILRDQRLEAFEGDISDYENDLLQRKKASELVIDRQNSGSNRSKQQLRQLAAKQREALKQRLRPIEQAIKACETTMENLRQSIAHCDARLLEVPGHDAIRWQEAAKTRAQCERMLQAQEDEWLELAGQLEHRRKQFFDDQAASNLNGHIAEF
ncbi:MAG: ABC transporter ATP-binding protein, partial [Betaproteobacteria bacterium]|nr:ABC transporter ATP-binding protein [Betaproteobacteria bacterium]